MSNAFEGVFPIGLGTNRFPFSRPENYQADFENAVSLVLYALEHGVNYIDTGVGYSGGRALAVVREALRRTGRDVQTTVKIQVDSKRQSGAEFDVYYAEALSVLEKLGLERASHFLLWSLIDREQFHRAVRKGGLYDVALRLKEEGRIRHIGASVHMTQDEILEVIDSGLFEFVMISYNLISWDMREILDRAYEKGVDILVMNPLYGGLIPAHETLFANAKILADETIVQAAVRAVLAHPAVKCVLAGASTISQMDEYLSSIASFSGQERQARLEALDRQFKTGGSYCSGCRYCEDCPQKIPVSELMNTRNVFTLLGSADAANGIHIFFRQLHEKYGISLESAEDPCIQCGKCESVCTQHLPIIQSIAEIYALAGRVCADKASRRDRLDGLLNGKGYRKVGFWPASEGTMKILEAYREFFGEPPFETLLFDSNRDLVGKEGSGYVVHGRDEAAALGPDCILITSYKYGLAIYDQIKALEEEGIAIKILYKPGDVDWWWC